jgi:hypothetical protein
MAYKNSKVLDSDIHIIEPAALWPRSIDPEFRDRGPSGVTEFPGDLRLASNDQPCRLLRPADLTIRRPGRSPEAAASP